MTLIDRQEASERKNDKLTKLPKYESIVERVARVARERAAFNRGMRANAIAALKASSHQEEK
jgi:hypothetical protein